MWVPATEYYSAYTHTHSHTLLSAAFNPERDAGLAVIYIIVLIRPVHSAALSAKPVIV